MKVLNFFKLLNNKIKKYDKFASNPFYQTREAVTIIWIEDKETKN